jgi:tRNA 2-selenouridine synthase
MTYRYQTRLFCTIFEGQLKQVMMYVNAQQFIENSNLQPVVDVRSPSEFLQGHIPGAINIPLFDDEERKRVGILYKNSGRDASVLLGLEIAGPKLSGFIKEVHKQIHGKEISIYCWRGGMRSSGMAWLFETAGYKVSVLQGGYKSYRKYIRQRLGEPIKFIVLGGYTGSGKSEILEFISQSGEQVLDLEKIACHKGSAFGDLGQDKQPTNEQFENELYFQLQKLDLTSVIWIEDESRGIGTVSIPEPLFKKMRDSRLIFIDIEKSVRVDRLVNEYAGFDVLLLENAILRISQRLGGLNTKLIIEALHNNDFKRSASILLSYYDKAYLKGVSDRNPSKVYPLSLNSGEPDVNAEKVLRFCNNLNNLKIHQLKNSFQ